MAFYTEVEFYVMAVVAAAAVVGMCIRPSSRVEARQYLISGTIVDGDPKEIPSIELEVTDEGKVVLIRRGLSGFINPDGAVSLSVTVAGFDISVEERIVVGRADLMEPAPTAAYFTLDFLGRERYHLKYHSETMGAMAAAPLHVRPGIKVFRDLA